MAVASGQKVFLDGVNGSGDTYLRELSANLMEMVVGGTTALRLGTGTVIIHTSSPPSGASDTGVAGTIMWDSGFIYICTATNTWKRVAIASW